MGSPGRCFIRAPSVCAQRAEPCSQVVFPAVVALPSTSQLRPVPSSLATLWGCPVRRYQRSLKSLFLLPFLQVLTPSHRMKYERFYVICSWWIEVISCSSVSCLLSISAEVKLVFFKYRLCFCQSSVTSVMPCKWLETIPSALELLMSLSSGEVWQGVYIASSGE